MSSIAKDNQEPGFTLNCECIGPVKKESPDYPIFVLQESNKSPSKASCDCIFLPGQSTETFSTQEMAGEGKIMLDIATMTISYPPQKKGRSFRPKVSEQLGVAITNYNPYNDSIAVSVDFQDRNVEYGEHFLGILNAGLNSSEHTKSTTTEEPTKETQAGGSDKKVCMKKLGNDLEEYYFKQKTKTIIDLQKLKVEIIEIEENIISCFKIEGKDIAGELKGIGEEEDHKKVVKFLKLIKTYQINTFLPFQVKNMDVTEITFHAYKNGHPTGSSTFEYLNKGGFKIDFSIGFIGTGLIDHKFITQTVQSKDSLSKIDKSTGQIVRDSLFISNKNKIIRSNEGDFSIGVGLLSHAYIRTGKRINPGITSGFTITAGAATNYLLGGSLLLGSERRLVLSYGKAWGKVKRLEDSLKEGELLGIIPNQINNGIALKDQWRNSWFFSISYNLGGTTIGRK